jgi:transcriptional regulator with XRE-family HTH domain
MKKQTLRTTNDFLDAVKSLKKIESDYALAKFLDVKPNTVSTYRHGKSFLDDEVCFRVADALGMPAEYVTACIHAERAKTDRARTVWTHVAAAFGTAAVLLLAVGILAPFPF